MSKNLKILLMAFGAVAVLALLFAVWLRHPADTSIDAVITTRTSPTPPLLSSSTPTLETTPSATAAIPADPALPTWKRYSSTEAGLTFRYPPDLELNPPQGKEYALPSRYLSLDAFQVAELPATAGGSGYDAVTAEADQKSLAGGLYGASIDWSQGDSSGKVSRVVNLGQANGKTYLTLRRAASCDLTLEYRLLFYWGGRQFRLGGIMTPELIGQFASPYLKADPATCGDKRIWSSEGEASLVADLASGTAPATAQKWLATMNGVIATISLTSPQALASDLDAAKVQAAIEAEPVFQKDAEERTFAMVSEKLAVGDLDHDGNKDAVAVMKRMQGERTIDYFLAVFLNKSGRAAHVLNYAALLQGSTYKSLSIDSGILTAVISDANSATTTRRYRLVESHLSEQ